MMKRLANGLIYDDFNDNLGQLIGGIVGTRIMDTEANRLAKDKQNGIDTANAEQWNSDNSSALADSAFGMKNNLAGISGEFLDQGTGDFIEKPFTPTTDAKAMDTSSFTNKFATNLADTNPISANTEAISKDLFMNRNRNRLTNAFSNLR